VLKKEGQITVVAESKPSERRKYEKYEKWNGLKCNFTTKKMEYLKEKIH